MTNPIRIQDPSWDDSEYLLDSTINACAGAQEGGASFAFVTAGGVKLLLDNGVFRKYLSTAAFDLIIGMDAITNTNAIRELSRVADQYPQFSCRAFIGSSLFHPKLSWFRKRQRVVALVGSGNLTTGGLRGNYEAFSALKLSTAEGISWRESWVSWLDRHHGDLYELDSNEVQERAAENDRAPRPRRRIVEPIEESVTGELTVGSRVGLGASALIAEIPRGAGRWGQGNFDLDTFTTFFGATPDVSRVIILTSVALDGTTGKLEERPSIASSSQNYRFELSATRGLNYPEVGRPTALFVRTAARTFRYRLFMPDQREHQEIARFLDREVGVPGHRMRRAVLDWTRIEQNRFARRLVN